jgi:hypothetical protein
MNAKRPTTSAICLVISVMLIASVLSAACADDPTDQVFSVSITNDLNEPVVLKPLRRRVPTAVRGFGAGCSGKLDSR